MKKYIIGLGALSLTQLGYAQENTVIQYPEEIYQYSDNADLNGTSRFKSLSGAMGALGGDLSATSINPAGSAVFVKNELSITGGVHSSKINPSNGSNFNDSEFNLNQIGGVLVFDDLNDEKWKSVVVGMNYQKNNYINEVFDANLNSISSDDVNLAATRFVSDEIGESSKTSLNVAANYNNRIYLGAAVNLHSFEINRNGEFLFEEDLTTAEEVEYYKDQSEWVRSGAGASLTLGVIGRVTDELRLGLSYQTPTWYTDVEESYVYYDDQDIDYRVGYAVNDKTTSQKITASGAYVIGKSGFISADYTYTDYSAAKFSPENDFSSENQYINNNLKGSSAIRVGGEANINNFKVRAGFRYEQSPFEELNVDGFAYQPYGDTTGYSLGAGYDFGGFYLDAAYVYSQRDRDKLIGGNFYSYSDVDDVFYGFNAGDVGYEQVIKNVEENKGNVSLTLGFRF